MAGISSVHLKELDAFHAAKTHCSTYLSVVLVACAHGGTGDEL